MARAGYCLVCGENVWLTEHGGCPKGHGPQDIARVYEAGGGRPVQAATPVADQAAPAAPSPNPKRTTWIVAAVLGGLLVLCACPAFALVGARSIFNSTPGRPGGASVLPSGTVPLGKALKADQLDAVKHVCWSNQRMIEAAARMWEAENPEGAVTTLNGSAWEEIFVASRYVTKVPVCPQGGHYRLNSGTLVPCPVHGHFQ